MFYVIQLTKSKKHVVVPVNWIKDHRAQLKKYINYGLNCNVELLVFYSPPVLERIRNGVCAFDYPPNFKASLSIEYPADGCYFGRPIKYFGEFFFIFDSIVHFNCYLILKNLYKISIDTCIDDIERALVFVQSRRSAPPAVYNDKRLLELPIPNIDQNEAQASSEDARHAVEFFQSPQDESTTGNDAQDPIAQTTDSSKNGEQVAAGVGSNIQQQSSLITSTVSVHGVQEGGHDINIVGQNIDGAPGENSAPKEIEKHIRSLGTAEIDSSTENIDGAVALSQDNNNDLACALVTSNSEAESEQAIGKQDKTSNDIVSGNIEPDIVQSSNISGKFFE